MSKQCSDIFSEVFDSHCGGLVRTCHCGRTVFNRMEEIGWEKGELEELMEKWERYPDLYIPTSNTVYTMNIDGIEIVYGCTCDTAKKYETFILDNAMKIAEYLKKYSKRLRMKADMVEVT